VGAGGGRSVGAAASAWRTTIRWSQQGVEGLVVGRAHDGGDELLDLGQHPVQDGLPGGGEVDQNAAAVGRAAPRHQLADSPDRRLRSRSPCVVAWTLNANDAN
jgi:hypothetical protein